MDNIFNMRLSEDNLNEPPKVIVTDFDECICDISPEWVKRIFINNKLFKDYFDLSDRAKLFPINIHNRDEYYLNKWLLKDGVELPSEIYDKFLNLYTEKYFYDNLVPTKLGLFLSEFVDTQICDSITIVSHTYKSHEDGKLKFIKKLFDGHMDKVTFIPVDNSIPKSIIINALNKDYTTFIDDRIEIVADVVVNTNSNGKELIIPKKGYNQTPKSLKLINEMEIKYHPEIYFILNH